MQVRIPTALAVVLGIAGGVAQVLNFSVIDASAPLHAGIATAILFLSGLGIPPLIGKAWQAALHLPSGVFYAVGVAMSAAMLILTNISISATAHEVIAAGLTVLAGLGFSPAAESVVIPVGNSRAK